MLSYSSWWNADGRSGFSSPRSSSRHVGKGETCEFDVGAHLLDLLDLDHDDLLDLPS